MGTKTNPSEYDCYTNAEADEPYFVLLARDRHAPGLIALWAELRERQGEDLKKVAEARRCAELMEAWRRDHRPMQPLYCAQCAGPGTHMTYEGKDQSKVVCGKYPNCTPVELDVTQRT